MSYKFVTNPDRPELGGNILEGDPLTHSPRTWDYLIERFAVRSVMDLGSGLGYAAAYIHKKGIPVLAVDGLAFNVRNAYHPTILHNINEFSLLTKVDMVICVETVEHIEEQYRPNLLRSLQCGKITVMSHAFPGQGGHHHVNCQPSEYWIKAFETDGSRYLDVDSERVRNIARNEGAHHLARSGLVFSNAL